MNSKDARAIQVALQKSEIDSLSAHQRDLFDKFTFADDVMRLYGLTQATKMVRMKFEVSEPTARQYLAEAQMLFGSTAIFERKYWRGNLGSKIYEAILALEADLFEEEEITYEEGLQVKKKKLKSSADAKVLKVYRELFKEFRELMRLDQEDPPPPPPDYVMPILTVNPEDIGLKRIENPDEIIDRFSIRLRENENKKLLNGSGQEFTISE